MGREVRTVGIGVETAGKGNGGRRDEQAVAEDGETYLPSVESSVDARTRTRRAPSIVAPALVSFAQKILWGVLRTHKNARGPLLFPFPLPRSAQPSA